MRQNVGRYRIVRPLGRGAMGLVYLADDPSLNRQVAIKMLDIAADSESDREFLRGRLLRDARAAAILSHPNVIAIYDIIEEGESVFVVMEYIEGESLATYLDHTPIPDHSFAVQVLRQMAAGLDYTHSKGIVHRDIKPGNVMIGTGQNVKLLDFGIARMNDGRTNTPSGMVMGTVDYMAPEQVRGAAVDGKADQFALAAVAYRMLAGSTLFGRHTLATLAYKLVNETPQPVRERNAEVPAEVDQVLLKALAKTPEERYPTCSAFVVALGQALFGTAPTHALPAVVVGSGGTAGITTRTPAGDVEKSGKGSKVAALVAGGALLAAAAGGLAIWRPWEHGGKLQVVDNVAPPVTKPVEPPPIVELPAERAQLPKKDPETKDTVAKKVVPPPVKKQESVIKETPPKELERPVVVVTPPPPPPSKEPEKTAKEVETPRKVSPPPDVATNSSSESGETPFARGIEQSKRRDFQGAIASFSEVLSKHPKNMLAYFNRGFALQMTGHPENAIADYNQAVQLGTKEARVFANRGVCEVRLHMDDAAFADFNRALELEPGYANALNGRGGVLLRRKQYRQAIQDFTSAINANPELAVAYENRALARQALHDPLADDDFKAAKRLQRK